MVPRQSCNMERAASKTVYLLEGLAKEMIAREDEFRKEYYIDFRKVANEIGDVGGVSFVASAGDLLMALQILSKNKGFKLAFSNPKQLSARLENESSLLGNAGWRIEQDKIVHGKPHYRFTKSF